MNDKKKIIHLLILVSIMFFSLVSYLLYINLFKAEEIASNPYNMRQWDEESSVHRGSIYDKNGVLLAETVKEKDGTQKRIYTKKSLYSHIIGYSSKVYGKTFLEREFDSYLNGKGDVSLNFSDYKRGFDLYLTIDNKMQSMSRELLNGRKGSVITMNPRTGEIYSMVSLPDFDPNPEYLESNWHLIVENEDSPLINRATSGLYPPGSTFKIITASAAFEKGYNERLYEDVGKFSFDGLEVNNFNNEKFGEINFVDAFKYSSNQVFCSIGQMLGAENMLEIIERFQIGSKTDFDIPVERSRVGYKKLTEKDCALLAIGQGKLLTTPLDMLLVTSAIANDGKMVKPYIVEKVSKDDGKSIFKSLTKEIEQPIEKSCAEYIKGLMVETVNSGTGKNAAISEIQVAGKTGTAENEKEEAHSWFVGFAPAENPEISVCVILENDGGSGGSSAAPIARNLLKFYFNNK